MNVDRWIKLSDLLHQISMLWTLCCLVYSASTLICSCISAAGSMFFNPCLLSCNSFNTWLVVNALTGKLFSLFWGYLAVGSEAGTFFFLFSISLAILYFSRCSSYASFSLTYSNLGRSYSTNFVSFVSCIHVFLSLHIGHTRLTVLL